MKSYHYILQLTLSVLVSLSYWFSPSASGQSSSNCVPKPVGLVSWWRAEGNAQDSVGTNYGIPNGSVGFASGEVGQAFVFDGASSVSVSDAPNLNFGVTSPMTVELWAYRTGTAPIMHLIGKRSSCSPDYSKMNYQLGFNEVSGEGIFFGDGPPNEATSGQMMPLNSWIHLTGVFDGTNFQLYTNGVLAGTHSGTLGPTNSEPLLIGASGSCDKFTGLIDEVSVYNRALSAGEVQAIYNAGTAGKCVQDEISVSIRISQVEICWNSTSNAGYQVQYRSDLTTNLWTPLVECVSGNGSNTCVQDPVVPGQPQKFYRVMLTNCVPFHW